SNPPHGLVAGDKSGTTAASRLKARTPRIVRKTLASRPVALDRQPALSAAQPDLAVLGGQYRAGALCRGSRAALDAVLRALDRRLHPALAVREGSSAKGLAGAPRQPAADAAAVGDRLRVQQRDLLHGASAHAGAERASDPVLRTAVRGAVGAAAV